MCAFYSFVGDFVAKIGQREKYDALLSHLLLQQFEREFVQTIRHTDEVKTEFRDDATNAAHERLQGQGELRRLIL